MFYRNDSWNLGSRADFGALARGLCDRLSACHRRLLGINSPFSLPPSCLLFSSCLLWLGCWVFCFLLFSLPFVSVSGPVCCVCLLSCRLACFLPFPSLLSFRLFTSHHCRSVPTWCCRGYEVLWRPDILCVSVI